MRAITRFNRDLFLDTVEVPEAEKDLLTNIVEESNGEYPVYVVTEFDIGRPDLISRKIYGTDSYWWYLMKFNGIDDVWNDLYRGMRLKYPSVGEMNLYVSNNNDKRQ